MEVVMKLASLGHAARNKSNVKVRQPLSEVAFAIGSADEMEVIAQFREILEDELNVKQVRGLGGSEEAVEYSLNPLPKQLGQKYKALSPKVRQAILDLPAKESAERLLAGLNLVIKVDDKFYEILPEEVEVHAAAKEGYSVATDGPYLAALVTTISRELFLEGLAREFVRRVQDQRKSLGLDIADRIKIYFQASQALSEAVKENEAYIAAETLALEVLDEDLPRGLTQAKDTFDGEELHFALQAVRGEAE
jgi:isoleucyl-tRNA synthetase